MFWGNRYPFKVCAKFHVCTRHIPKRHLGLTTDTFVKLRPWSCLRQGDNSAQIPKIPQFQGFCNTCPQPQNSQIGNKLIPLLAWNWKTGTDKLEILAVGVFFGSYTKLKFRYHTSHKKTIKLTFTVFKFLTQKCADIVKLVILHCNAFKITDRIF